MKNVLEGATIFLVFICVVLASAVSSGQSDSDRQQIKTPRGVFTTRANPITLPMPIEEGAFQFVIYGDRTGGNPAGLKFLRQAVADTNLLDPDFVMTVGDLIQGYNRPADWMVEMKEFREIMGGLNMNWMPVAGNHDIYWDFRDPLRPKGHHESNYEKHFGPLWYSFTHKEQGFIVLYSDEGNAETGEKGFREARLQNVSPEQMMFLEQSLEKLRECNQVFLFLHHPRWLGGGYEGSNWPEVHKRLAAAGNVSAVFAGHIHHMTYAGPLDGIEYYTLGTTGGHMAMDAPELGHLHHYNVVNVRKQEFTVATFPVGAVIDPKNFKAEFLADVEIVRGMRPKRFGDKLKLDLKGEVASNYSISIPNPGKFPIEVTVSPKNADGWRALPDHQHVIVPPGKTEGMSFYFHRKTEKEDFWAGFTLPKFAMSVDYLHESARVRLPEVSLNVDTSIAELSETEVAGVQNNCLQLRGVQSEMVRQALSQIVNDSVRVNSADVKLHQGPFTLEAWVNPTELSQSRAVVAKTQSSEYALFLHDGKAEFNVHLDGKYASPNSDSKVEKNVWTHLAGVYDGNQARLYVNGKLVEALDCTGTRTTNSLPLYVGADPDGNSNPTREFGGQIDEVRLSSKVRYLDAFEPAARFNRDDETLLLLHLDQSVGPFLIDDSSPAATAIRIGQATIAERN